MALILDLFPTSALMNHPHIVRAPYSIHAFDEPEQLSSWEHSTGIEPPALGGLSRQLSGVSLGSHAISHTHSTPGHAQPGTIKEIAESHTLPAQPQIYRTVVQHQITIVRTIVRTEEGRGEEKKERKRNHRGRCDAVRSSQWQTHLICDPEAGQPALLAQNNCVRGSLSLSRLRCRGVRSRPLCDSGCVSLAARCTSPSCSEMFTRRVLPWRTDVLVEKSPVTKFRRGDCLCFETSADEQVVGRRIPGGERA